MPVECASFYTACLVCAMEHLHHKKILYRDLKPENVMIDAHGYPNLIDMGLAKILPSGERAYSVCGTPEYMAPEVFLGKGYGLEADWWTVGILLYELLMGYTPYSHEGQETDPRRILRNIISDEYTYRCASRERRTRSRAPQALTSPNKP